MNAEPTLNLRRAIFVYDAARLAALAAGAPVIPVPWVNREQAFKDQFLPVIEKQCGPNRSLSPMQLHAEWVIAYEKMGWEWGPEHDPVAKEHPDMVRYEQLGKLEQDKDAVFVELCEIARVWIYDQ
jgi:hypothetical protein